MINNFQREKKLLFISDKNVKKMAYHLGALGEIKKATKTILLY